MITSPSGVHEYSRRQVSTGGHQLFQVPPLLSAIRSKTAPILSSTAQVDYPNNNTEEDTGNLSQLLPSKDSLKLMDEKLRIMISAVRDEQDLILEKQISELLRSCDEHPIMTTIHSPNPVLKTSAANLMKALTSKELSTNGQNESPDLNNTTISPSESKLFSAILPADCKIPLIPQISAPMTEVSLPAVQESNSFIVVPQITTKNFAATPLIDPQAVPNQGHPVMVVPLESLVPSPSALTRQVASQPVPSEQQNGKQPIKTQQQSVPRYPVSLVPAPVPVTHNQTPSASAAKTSTAPRPTFGTITHQNVHHFTRNFSPKKGNWGHVPRPTVAVNQWGPGARPPPVDHS